MFDEVRHRRAVREIQEALRPVMAELRQIGFAQADLHDLRRSGVRYEKAIPILLRWLPRLGHSDAKEDLVRTLSVPWAKGEATVALLDEYRKAPRTEEGLRWAIGNALEVLIDRPVVDDVIRIVSDPANGRSRQMFVLALGKCGRDRTKVVPVLRELLQDDDVAGHAISALGRLKAVEAKHDVLALTGHRNEWIRRSAKRIAAGLDKVHVQAPAKET